MAFGAPVLGRTGGHEYVVQNLSEGVVDEDFEVRVVCPSLDNNFATRQKKCVRYLLIPSYRIHNRVRFVKFSFLRVLVQEIRRADMIHIHCPDNPFAFVIGLLSKLMGKPVVVTILAYGDDLKRQELFYRLLGIVTVIQQTIAALTSDKIHVEGLYDESKLHFFRKKTVLIPPGISDDVIYGFPSSISQKKVKEKIKKSVDCKIVLYLGRIQRVKGLDHAVCAVALLRKIGVKVKLVIAGPDDGYFSEVMKKFSIEYSNGTFIYLGKVSEDEKLALLDLSSALIVPSITDVVEAYSIVASEAWARKKPVVSYFIGALKYRVVDGVNGFVANPLNTDQLSKKLFLALTFSKHINLPSDIMDWTRVSQEFKRLYNSLGNERRKS